MFFYKLLVNLNNIACVTRLNVSLYKLTPRGATGNYSICLYKPSQPSRDWPRPSELIYSSSLCKVAVTNIQGLLNTNSNRKDLHKIMLFIAVNGAHWPQFYFSSICYENQFVKIKICAFVFKLLAV